MRRQIYEVQQCLFRGGNESELAWGDFEAGVPVQHPGGNMVELERAKQGSQHLGPAWANACYDWNILWDDTVEGKGRLQADVRPALQLIGHNKSIRLNFAPDRRQSIETPPELNQASRLYPPRQLKTYLGGGDLSC